MLKYSVIIISLCLASPALAQSQDDAQRVQDTQSLFNSIEVATHLWRQVRDDEAAIANERDAARKELAKTKIELKKAQDELAKIKAKK